jgi:hypothetical protein
MPPCPHRPSKPTSGLGHGEIERLEGGTDGSNLAPSSGESKTNPESLDQAVLISGGPQLKRRRVPAPGPDRPHVIASDDRAAAPKSKQSKLRVQPGRRVEVEDLDEACQKLEKAQGRRLTAKEVSDAAMRHGVHANFEMKWSGPDGVVIDVSHTGWEGTH